MTRSSTQSQRDLKTRPPSRDTGRGRGRGTETAPQHVVEINFRSSLTHSVVLLALASLSLLAPISTQLPGFASAFIWVWTLACLVHLYRTHSSLTALHDLGDSWQLVYAGAPIPARYKTCEWCNAYLILMSFTDDSGRTYRVPIWRDSVTQPAFSWLAARVTLTSADKKVKTVATSNFVRFAHNR